MSDKAFTKVNTFVDMNKDLVKASEDKAKGNGKKTKDSRKKSIGKKRDDRKHDSESAKNAEITQEKRAENEQEQESSKRQRMEYDKETKELKSALSLVLMMRKEDLVNLWRLVKAKHGNNRPEEAFKRTPRKLTAVSMYLHMAYPDYPSWEVIQNGNGPVSITTDIQGQIKVLPPRIAEEILARERERKVRTTLLMALPEDHLAKFHKMIDAKEMWEAIKSRFSGNDESKKMQKYILKQQFEGFFVSNSEGLHKGYDRFQSLLSQLEIHGAGVSTMDANQKFLRSLPSAWSQVSLVMRTKPGVDSLSFDDLYNNLRVFEFDVKGSNASSLNTQNVAFVLENTSSTNDVSTAYGVSNSTDIAEALKKEFAQETKDLLLQAGATKTNSTNIVNTASTPVSTANPYGDLTNPDQDDSEIPALEEIYANPTDGIFTNASYDDEGAVADFTNLETIMNVSPIPTSRINSFNPSTLILGDPQSVVQTRSKVTKSSGSYAFVSYIQKQRRNNHKDFQHCLFTCFLSQNEPKKISEALEDKNLPYGKKAIGIKWVYKNKKDERGVVVRNKARIEAIRIFLAFASYMGFIVYQMDVKSAFLYGKIDEEVYVSQPPGFVDPKYPKKVYKVVKALYGLHQAPRAWYATLSTFLLKSGYKRGTIDKTLFIKKDKNDIMLVQVYVDDIIFGSTKRSWCDEFEALMKSRFQMSSMGELTFFLGLQVKQKEDGIFISQDKYVAEILKKFDFVNVKTASTPIETQKPLVKDEEASDVDVHLYRSMFGSLMYLTTFRPNIMFAVCACSRFQVILKTSHLHAVKRIFRYLKGKPKLGLWYPRVSSFDLEAYSNSDYARENLDRKSTIGEAEYVATASCYRQVLWIQNQMLDYRFNFINIKIYIDNESTICIVKNPVYHSKTKHIAIRHHFIRDAYEKKLIQVLKIYTDDNVADLLTKDFDLMNVPVPLDHFLVNALTSKVFSFMVKKGKHFSGKVTPLFAFMLVQTTEDEGATSKRPFEPQPTSIPEASGGNHRGQSSSDRSLLGTEGDMTLQSVYDLCISLCSQVTDQAKQIKHLQAQIKKLKKKAKPVITHHRAWMKSGRKSAKAEPSVHKDPLFDEIPDDTVDYIESKNAQDVGRTSSRVSEEKETADDEVSAEDVLSTAQQNFSTDKEKFSTDIPNVSTDKPKVSTDKEKDSTDRKDEVFLNMSQAKAVSREKEKGVELKDVEETERPRPTSTRSLLTLKPLPKIDPKDKGKKKIEEEDESKTESEGNRRRKRLAEQEAIKTALLDEYDIIQARIEADKLLALRLQNEEREQFTVEERAKFLHDIIAA
ncbi:putative ribonuclease H-like domain-containing protein [Tanacetum coccineum]